jgi:hypothetical protein
MRDGNFLSSKSKKVTSRSYGYFLKFVFNLLGEKKFLHLGQKLCGFVKKARGIPKVQIIATIPIKAFIPIKCTRDTIIFQVPFKFQQRIVHLSLHIGSLMQS